MYPSHPENNPLRRFFAGLTEYAFEGRLGVADPALIDYITELLTRFLHFDALHCVRNPTGRRLDQVVDMLAEAEARVGDARREVHRHIGDYALFWTGLYPEAIQRMSRCGMKDGLLDYRQTGKRAYLIASTIASSNAQIENELLERLSHDFELCAYGLGEVRREWQRRDDDPQAPPTLIFN